MPRSGSSSARRRMLTPVWTSPSAWTRVERGDGVDQRHAAAGDDAFFDRRAGRAQRVLDAVLLLLQLGLGRGADLDHRHAAGQLGQPLLQLLAVEVGGRRLDLGADLLDAALDRRLDRRAPSMKVVSSLVETTRRARPRSPSVDAVELAADLLGDRPGRRSGRRCRAASPCGGRRSPAP